MKVACVTENCTRTPISGAVAGALYLSLQRADSSPYFASGELCHSSWRADIDTVYFQHLPAYRTSAQSCSVWDLVNGTLVGLLTDSRHFSPRSIYERSVESTGTRRPNARLPISFEVPRCPCDILLETQVFYEVGYYCIYIKIVLETEIKKPITQCNKLD